MIRYEDTYRIGKITKAHGLKGEVVFVFDDDIFDRIDSDYLICDVDGILVPFFMEEYRFRNESSALVKFDGMDTAEAVQDILGAGVYFEKKLAKDADEEEMSLHYFVGFTMKQAGGDTIGKIVDIDDNTANWLFVVERQGGGEAMIPAHEEFIYDIDHEAKEMTVDLPEGLLEL